MKKSRFDEQYPSQIGKYAQVSGWTTPGCKSGNMTTKEISISAINKKEALKLIEKEYPNFEFFNCYFASTKKQMGGYDFKRIWGK